MESESSSVDDPSSTPIESSGTSYVSPKTTPKTVPRTAPTRPSQPKESLSLKCDRPQCRKRKAYKTRNGYDKHILAHRASDAYGRVPNLSEFTDITRDLMKKVMAKLSLELKCSCPLEQAMKQEFIEKTLENEEKWCTFVNLLSEPIVKCLVGPTKLLPQNRFEEALKMLNTVLNSEVDMNNLCSALTEVSDMSLKLARRLIFRLAHLLLEEVQVFIAREMRGQDSASATPASITTGGEYFEEILSSLLRSFFRKGWEKESESKMWRSVCRCLKEKFVSSSMTTEQFLDKDHWKSHDPTVAVPISSSAVSFFLSVEHYLMTNNQGVPGPNQKVINSVDETLPLIFKDRDAMEAWFCLTNNFFSEENSIYVMKLMVISYRELSLVLEENLRNRLSARDKNIALRTNLKRT